MSEASSETVLSSKKPYLSKKLRIEIRLICLLIGLLKILGRMKVRGAENIKRTPTKSRLVFPNHLSHLDPIIIPLVGWMPEMLQDPETYFPWQTPNTKSLEDSGFSFLKNMPVILIKTDEEGRPNDAMSFRKVIRQLEHSTFIIFPEAMLTWHSDEPRIQTSSGVSIGNPLGGIGFLVANFLSKGKPLTIIPTFVKGTDRVFPHDASPLRIIWSIWFNRMEITFGSPLDLSSLCKEGDKPTKETYQKISKAVVEAIAALDV